MRYLTWNEYVRLALSYAVFSRNEDGSWMPKLRPEKPLVITQKLRHLGYEGPFGGGRLFFMRHPESRIKISVPAHGGRDIPVGTLAAIIKQAGVSVEEWLAV